MKRRILTNLQFVSVFSKGGFSDATPTVAPLICRTVADSRPFFECSPTQTNQAGAIYSDYCCATDGYSGSGTNSGTNSGTGCTPRAIGDACGAAAHFQNCCTQTGALLDAWEPTGCHSLLYIHSFFCKHLVGWSGYDAESLVCVEDEETLRPRMKKPKAGISGHQIIDPFGASNLLALIGWIQYLPDWVVFKSLTWIPLNPAIVSQTPSTLSSFTCYYYDIIFLLFSVALCSDLLGALFATVCSA